nr:Pol polyprotein [Tanacetum cinerariifolium]
MNEEKYNPQNIESNTEEDDVWYFYNEASNHKIGNYSYLYELNENIKGHVRFGDGLCVSIKGKWLNFVPRKNKEQKLLKDIYYIAALRSNVISLRQATLFGYNISIRGDFLTMRDSCGSLLLKVPRITNYLYKAQLKVGKEDSNQASKEPQTFTVEAIVHETVEEEHETNDDQQIVMDFDEVFAPVARLKTIRLLIALAAEKGWKIHHFDVKKDFLHGDLKELDGRKLSKAEDELEVEGTTSFGIKYKRGSDMRLVGYSSHNVDIDDGRSSTGHIFYLGTSPITWCLQKQTTIALSLCEADFMKTTAAMCQSIWLIELLVEVKRNAKVISKHESRENQREDPFDESLYEYKVQGDEIVTTVPIRTPKTKHLNLVSKPEYKVTWQRIQKEWKGFKKSIFKQREEINDRMMEMFRLLKELTIRTPEKFLVREQANNPITRCINTISLVKIGKDKSIENNEVIDKNVIEPSELNKVELIEEEMEDITDNELVGGIDKDVLIDIAGYVYLVDFIILDIEEDKNKPLILGTPFLTMAKAEIRFDKRTITLKSNKNKINFFKILESPCEIKIITKEDIDPITLTNIVIFDEEKPESSLDFCMDYSWMII